MAKPVIAGAMMIAAALLSVALWALAISFITSIVLAGMLVMAAILLFIGGPWSRLIGIIATAIGAAGFVYLLINPMLPLMRMGAISALACLIPLGAVVLLAVALVLILMWRPVKA